MISSHRDLLGRLAEFNRDSPQIVVNLLAEQDGGELPPAGLRALGRALATLAADCIALAEDRPIDHIIIDARPEDPSIPWPPSLHPMRGGG